MPGTRASIAMSYTPWWLGPSGPVMPARSRQNTTGQAVQRHVVHDLVPRPVEERRVDRDDRAQPAHRHAGGPGDGVLLGDADVEEAVGETLLERQQSGRAGHRRGDRDDALVVLGQLDDGLGERLRVPRGHGLGRADHRVEHRRVVEVLLVVVLGRRVAAALLGEHVDDDRALGRQLDGVAERRLELGDVVPVDRPDVAHAERLEERRWLEELADGRLDRLDGLLGRGADERHLAQELLELALPPHIDRVEADVGQRARQPVADPRRSGVGCSSASTLVARPVGREVGDRRRVAAAVVVEHDDDPAPLWPRLFSASYAMPPVIDPSPITATMWRCGSAPASRATARP